MSYCIPLDYTRDGARYYAAISGLPWAAWLDSAGLGRYDILSAQPAVTLTARDNGTIIADAAGSSRSEEPPFEVLRRQLGDKVAAMPSIPFAGGALGYWGYDLARRLIDLPARARNAEHLPDMAVGIYDWAVVLDHQARTAHLASHLRHPATARILPEILERLRGAGVQPGGRAPRFHVNGPLRSNLSQRDYLSAFKAVQNYLYAGDCYQVNLAQRYAAPASGDAFEAYTALRALSPAPYSAFLNLPYAQILCASPEQFLHVSDGKVETRPIKGTRPRMEAPAEDARLADELAHSAKDRAENLMIVDLLRNDLGRHCKPGSVHVSRLFEVESYAHVHHLVSTIAGQLAEGQDALALLKGCFPGGSITGAPKKRAMEIIEELEPNRRGVYCGAIGYIGYDGNMDTNIAIRTLVYSGNEIRFWAGGGIVADSSGPAEYQETLDKAAAMAELLRRFSGPHRKST